jgi:pimeloyl-ACP methyl ester carboxylesterase
VPYLELPSSALAPGTSPVRVHYRDAGEGCAIVILHGGWGYEIYPFERQVDVLAVRHRVVIPDRTGYGQSGRLERQATDFHHRAAAETFALIDALALDRPIVWGHSDGAVIALLMGLADPDRVSGLIVEAVHFFRSKPGSRGFFEAMTRDPDGLGERATSVLARAHGEPWREVLRANGDAWLRIAGDAAAATSDLYGGRLGDLRVPTLVIHGGKDPRTEPGELDAMRKVLHVGADLGRPEGGASSAPTTHIVVLPEAGHSPHSERATADEVTQLADRFVRELFSDPPAPAAEPAQPGLPAQPDRPDLLGLPDPPGLPAPPARRDQR